MSAISNDRGHLLEDWAAELDLRVLNNSTEYTYIRPQGMSIIDLTWTSPELLTRINNWRVRTDLQSLSDHLYIGFSLDEGETADRCTGDNRYPRWKWSLFDEDLFLAVAGWHSHNERPGEEFQIEEQESRLTRILKEACDVAAPTVKKNPPREQAYWWNEEIAETRRESIRARREWKRSLRRRGNIDEGDNMDVQNNLQREYRRTKKRLRAAIRTAKSKAWQELLDSIEKDPCGMPYRLVLKKLRRSKPSLLETISHETAVSMMENLFPAEGSEELSVSANRRRERHQARPPNEECEVTVSDMERVFWRRPAGNSAPGPDGIPAKILRKIPAELLESIRGLYSRCLHDGHFPRENR